MKTIKIGPLLFCLSLISFTYFARADEVTNREIIQTFVNYHLSQKEFSEAEEKLVNHLNIDSKDSERWNLLGLVRVEMKKYKEADEAFEEAANTAPPEVKCVYYYNHAAALSKLDRQAEVETLLKKAMADDRVRDSARAALDAVRNGQEPPPLRLIYPGQFSFGTSLMAGYDSNVQLIAINTLDSISRSDTASYVVIPSVRAGYKKDFYNGLMDASTNFTYSYYTNSETSKFNSVLGALQARWIPDYGRKPFVWGVNTKVNLIFLNTDGYKFYNWNQGFGLEAEWTHSANSKTTFEIPLRLQRFDDVGDSNNFRTGVAVGAKGSHRFRLKASQMSAGLEVERVWTRGGNYKSYQYTVPVSWARGLGRNWIGSASLRAGQVFYIESATNRRDTSLNPTLAVNKIFTSAFTTSISYSYTRNISSVDSASYQKHNAFLAANYEF